MWLHVANATNNKFQTRGTVEANVEAFMESVKSTSAGYWDNNLATPAPGFDIPDVTGLDKKAQLELTKDFKWINVYGQQRLEGLRRLKIKYIDIPVKPLTEKEMLVICANENLETYGGDLMTTIGAVEQVYTLILNQLSKAATWAHYQKAGFDMLTSKTQFDNAVKQGVGYKIILSTLGKAWKVNTVRGAKNAVVGIKEGLFTKEEVQNFTSMDGVTRFVALARKILSLDYPEAFKRELIANSIVAIQKHGASGKTIDLTSSGLDEGFDPVRYLKDQMPVSLADKFMKKVRAILTEGGEMYPDVTKDVIKDAQKQIDKAAKDELKRLEKEEDGVTDNPDAAPQGDLPPPELFGGSDDTHTGNGKDAKLVSFNMSVPVLVSEINGILDIVDETIDDEETVASIASVFTSATKLYAARFGYKALRALIATIQKG